MKKEAGFTLVEVMIAFTILLIVASLLPQLIQVVSFDPKFKQRLETALFFQQITFDLHDAAEIYVSNNTLYLKKADNKTISYGLFQQRIRRQVNHLGQEVTLQNVLGVLFLQYENGVDIKIEDKFGQRHEKRISHLLPVEDMNNER